MLGIVLIAIGILGLLEVLGRNFSGGSDKEQERSDQYASGPSSNPALSSSSSHSHLSSKNPSLSSSGPSSKPALSSSSSSSSHLSSKNPSLSSSGPSSNHALPSSLPSPKPTPSSLPSSNPFASSASPSTSPFSSLSSSKPSTLSNASPTLHFSWPQSPPSGASPTATVAVTQSEERWSGQLDRYEIPKHLEEQIKKDVVPEVLTRPLTPSTYAHYFAALLYAEDFYIEKWSNFLLSGVTLKLQGRETFETFSRVNKNTNETILMNKKSFVSFEIDVIPERRPYLLSRDFVFLKGSCKTEEPFKGVLFRVVKSTTVLVEFGEDFHSQHRPSNKYDVSFSFNRVCLKRCHQAISAAKGSLFHDVLFPAKPNTASSSLINNTVHLHRDLASRIVNHRGPTPYLIEGPLSLTSAELSATGNAIQQAIKKIYWTSPHCRILVCAPTNQSCDSVMQSLLSQIPGEKLFRANAAFRDFGLVPGDIIPQSLHEGECFTCPSLYELLDFEVITSTYVSSFRLHTAGVKADHFTHIFLVDASSAMEPEVVVPLANFVGKNTVIVATGSSGNSPRWVRSDMARRHGLKRSYFERLLEREPYVCRDPAFITDLK